jgi:hypothetical protein
MKKLFLFLIVLSILGIGTSFGKAIEILCGKPVSAVKKDIAVVEDTAVVHDLSYYLKKTMSPRTLETVAVYGDTHLDDCGRKLIGIGGVHLVIGSYVQNYWKTGEDNKYMMALIDLMEKEGYKPVKEAIEAARELLSLPPREK